MSTKKRNLIVTGAGLGTALLALLVAVASGGPALLITHASFVLGLIPALLLSLIAAVFLIAAYAGLGLFGGTSEEWGVSLYAWTLSALFMLASAALLFGGDWPAVIAWGALGAIVAEYLTTRHTRRWREARERAVERIAERKRVAEARRADTVKQATRRVATDWLTDALSAPESAGRLMLLADLDPDTAWALARLHRKGVPAEYVAERWTNGSPLDADALVSTYRNGAAS